MLNLIQTGAGFRRAAVCRYIGGGSHLKAGPFVKWAGGKCRILDEIRRSFPNDFRSAGIKTYVEPFVGGGSVLFSVLSSFEVRRCIINDSNEALIDTYRTVRDNVESLILRLDDLEQSYLSLNGKERDRFYYRKRTSYNALRRGRSKDLVEISALFLYLNKTCYNGIFRTNRSGEFNVPVGSYDHQRICDRENLTAASRALESVEMYHQDFREFFRSIGNTSKDCFIYIDPPYAIHNGNNGFLGYNDRIFSWDDQVDLAKCVVNLASDGAKIMVSNAKHRDIVDLYARFARHEVSRCSVIGGTKESRRTVKEMIITTYPVVAHYPKLIHMEN